MASLSSIRVPTDALPFLKRLADLDDAQADALVRAMSSGDTHERVSLENAAASVLVDGVGWSREDMKALVGNLLSMSMLGTSHGFSTTDLAKTLAEKAGEASTKAERNNLDSSAIEVLSARLKRLLDAPDLVAFSKAVDIYTEFDRLLHLSRILTDIRPVFGSGENPKLLGALIVHTLKLDYRHAGRLQTASFVMDEIDLSELKKMIERAEEKAQALSEMLDAAGLAVFDVTKESDD